MIPQSSDSLGNVLRLKGLKNVAGRRKVLPGAQYLQDLETPAPDVEETNQDLPNMPQEDFGQEFSPQSYDVRANEVIEEPQEQDAMYRLGKALAAPQEPAPQTPPIETQQVDLQEGIPPVSSSQQVAAKDSGFLNSAGKFLQSAGILGTPEEYQQNLAPQGALQEEPGFLNKLAQSLKSYGILGNPEEYQQNLPPEPPLPEGQLTQEALSNFWPTLEEQPLPPEAAEIPAENPAENAVEEPKDPGTYVEMGSVEQLLNNPNTPKELKSEIERVFNVSLTPEMKKQAEEFEKVVDAYVQKLNGVDVALDRREQQLLQKVENRDLSTNEQIAMAIALVAPALIAGIIGGKQGFATALAKSGESVANTLRNSQKEMRENEELLPQIALEKAKIGKEKLETEKQAQETKKKIMESTSNEALRKLFLRDGYFTKGNKLVLDTGNPLLPLKSTAIRSDKDFENFREKKMPELSGKLVATEQAVEILDSLNRLVDISEGINTGGVREWIPFYDTAAKAMKAYLPFSRDTFVDENGNHVKVSELFETNLEQLSDAYSQAVTSPGSKAAFKTYREHFREMLPNPFTLGSLIQGKTQLGTTRAQINSVKDKFEKNIIHTLDNAGVDTDPVKDLIKSSAINTKKSEDKRKKDRAEAAAQQVMGS